MKRMVYCECLPRETITVVPHVLDPPAHDLSQLLLVDPDHLLLRNVIVFVLLYSSVLTAILKLPNSKILIKIA